MTCIAAMSGKFGAIKVKKNAAYPAMAKLAGSNSKAQSLNLGTARAMRDEA